jgi:hypothetical protein
MNYLYGDSTASELKANVLEFFRDALDCSVVLLQADAKIDEGQARLRSLREAADAELAALETFIGDVQKTIRSSPPAEPESAVLLCATRLATLCVETKQAFANAVRERLAREVAAVEAQEAAERQTCNAALTTLLLGQPPPDATTVTRLALGAGQPPTYEAALTGVAELGLDWTFELAIPEGNAWSAPVRVDRFVPQLEIRTPQLAGWISKEVKIRPQKLDRFVVTELVDDGQLVSLKLRAEGGADGFDLEVDCDAETVESIARVGAKDDASVGPFDLHADDVRPLVQLADKLRATLADLTRVRLRVATVEDAPFHEQERFAGFVEKVVAMMAPILREISDRSLTQNELVLRRLLSNDRREEIFVAKSTLREKLAVLPDEARLLFAPLRLDPIPPLPGNARTTDRPVPAENATHGPPPARAELPHSRPPPPMPAPSAPPPPPAEPARVSTSSFSDERITVVADESFAQPEATNDDESQTPHAGGL